MLIIVEGVDCVGKTTFVKQLQDAIPAARVLRSGPPKSIDSDPFEEYEQRLYEFLDDDAPIIADRWHWGEKAYGPILRGHDRLSDAGWRHVELFLAAQGAVVVYLHQPRSVLVDCLEERGDNLIRQEHLIHIEVGYQWCVRNTILPVIALRDFTPDDVWRVTALAGGYSPKWYAESYVGRWSPDALLFGEKRGGQPPHVDRAAFVPRRSTSGYHLLSNLPENLWGRLGIANALEEKPIDVWNHAGQPPVVALGRWSHVTLDQHEIPHATVPHPQFVRRFLHGHLAEYGQLIADVIGTEDDLLAWRGSSEEEKI